MQTRAENEALTPEERLERLKLAKGGTWYDGWQPFCLNCAYNGRMTQMSYGFQCPGCKNMIGWDCCRLVESPLNPKADMQIAIIGAIDHGKTTLSQPYYITTRRNIERNEPKVILVVNDLQEKERFEKLAESHGLCVNDIAFLQSNQAQDLKSDLEKKSSVTISAGSYYGHDIKDGKARRRERREKNKRKK